MSEQDFFNERDFFIIGSGCLASEFLGYLKVDFRPNRYIYLVGKAQEKGFFEKLSGVAVDAVIGVGSPALRQSLSEKFHGARWVTSIHNSVYNQGATCEHGVVVAPNCSLTTNIILFRHVFLNLNCTVGHDTRIGAYSVVNPGVNISGNVTIGKRVLVGTGACIRDGVTIGDDAVIGMGAVVVKDVPAGMTVVGNPAAEIKRRT